MIYRVKSNIKHDGQVYSKGDKIELKEEVATNLLSDGIIVATSETIEDEDRETPQPPVNTVKRDGEETEGEASIEEGKTEKPQPGDNVDDDEDDEDEDEDDL